MPNYNKLILIGHITRDIEVRYTPKGTPAAEFCVASSHKWKDADGNSKEDTAFVDCKMYGKRCEVMAKFLHKGDPVLVEGRLLTESWEKDGQKRSKLVAMIDNFEFVGGNRSSDAAPEQQPKSNKPSSDDVPF